MNGNRHDKFCPDINFGFDSNRSVQIFDGFLYNIKPEAGSFILIGDKEHFENAVEVLLVYPDTIVFYLDDKVVFRRIAFDGDKGVSLLKSAYFMAFDIRLLMIILSLRLSL